MQEMKIKARAKVNLGLDVLGRRENGYHDLRMIMQTLDLYDMVSVSMKERPGITIKTNLSFLPVNEDNLAYRAAALLADEFGERSGLVIDLEKNIPVAAGLAGGSSNCVAVLKAVNSLWGLGLSDEELMKRGVKLGADVPYCIMQGTALAEGIGEKLTALPTPPEMTVLLAKPDISVSTKYVYTHLQLNSETVHPDIDGQIEALKTQDAKLLADKMGNVLETVTCSAYPIIEELKATMKEFGAMNAMMSGSGPTVFGLYADEKDAGAAFAEISRKDGVQIHLTHFWNPGDAE